MFVLVFVILIVISRNFEKSHYDNENQRLFCRKIEKKKPQKEVRYFVLHTVYVEEKVDSGKVQLTDGTEGWIESNAIREVK
jgi:hypothetical protein